MSDDKLFRTWCGRLEREMAAHKGFREQAKKAMVAFERTKTKEDIDKNSTGYPVWWSNVQITFGAIFARQPKPDVRRRLADSGADKQLSLAIERSLSYQMDTSPWSDHSNRAVTEFLVTALGVTRVYLKTDYENRPVQDPMTGQPIMGDDGEPMTFKAITGQYTCLEYIPYDLFQWEPCKDWEDCGWVAFNRWMSAPEIKAEYGEDMGEREGDYSDSPDSNKPGGQKYANLHLVSEIWDKKKREIITLCSTSKKYGKPLKVEPDKYRLKDFYPCARPMLLNLLHGELTPMTDYHWIASMCDEIDNLTDRIKGLVKGLKDVALFDASFGADLANLMNESDGARIGVASLNQKLAGSSIAFITDDLRQKIEVVVQLVNERDRSKAELYELTGISDIVRGATRASETATAQQLKSQWASVRLNQKMREVSMHFRSTFRVMAELISEHFEPEQITAQSGIQITPEMQQMMRSDIGRTYAIDIESDSTIAQDEEGEKAARLEFVQGVTQFMQTIVPMQQQGMIPNDFANAILRFYVASFPHGRVIEEQIDALPGTQQQLQETTTKLQQAEQAGQQANQQLQAIQAEMAKVQQQAAADKADLEQQIAQLTQRAQAKPESPTKQIRDMAAARKDEAIAAEKEASAFAINQQAAQEQMFGPM